MNELDDMGVKILGAIHRAIADVEGEPLIFAVVVLDRGDGNGKYIRIAEVDSDRLFTLIGAVESLKAKLLTEGEEE